MLGFPFTGAAGIASGRHIPGSQQINFSLSLGDNNKVSAGNGLD